MSGELFELELLGGATERRYRKLRPEVRQFPNASTERAELEHFAQAAAARRPVALPGGDEAHNVAVLEAIVRSSRDGVRVPVA